MCHLAFLNNFSREICLKSFTLLGLTIMLIVYLIAIGILEHFSHVFMGVVVRYVY